MKDAILKTFHSYKPVIGMLHLKGDAGKSILERAKTETALYFQNGVDAVLVEDYSPGCTVGDCEAVLAFLKQFYPEKVYGINVLGDYEKAFELAAKCHARFIQIDSVSGHLPPLEDMEFAERLNTLRRQYNGVLLGGVRFKYKPVRSMRSLEEDLVCGIERCDAIVVTGRGTGELTPLSKLKKYRALVGDFPLLIGAGMTPERIAATLPLCDGYIVGSYFKERHIDKGDVYAEHVRSFTAEKARCDSARQTVESKAVIDRFEGEYAFLSMKAPARIELDGFVYPDTGSAYYALSVPEAYRAQFEALTARKARKLWKELPHLESGETKIEERLYRVVKARFGQDSAARGKLLGTGAAEILYDTTGSHDNALGRCRCADCQGKECRNLYGQALMCVRGELRETTLQIR